MLCNLVSVRPRCVVVVHKILSPHHTTHKVRMCKLLPMHSQTPLAWYNYLTLAPCGRELLSILERMLKGYAMYLVSVRPWCLVVVHKILSPHRTTHKVCMCKLLLMHS